MYYSQLKQLVKDGKIKFTFLISLPRSNSTAFELALQQAYGENDIQLGAPWFSKKYDAENPVEFDLGCKRIYEEVQKKLAQSKNHRINILLKSHASHLEYSEFTQILTLCSEFGVLYRDPYSQLQSMITRMGNDLVCPGGNALKYSEALNEMIKQDKLQECLQTVQSHWQHLIMQYRLIKAHADKKLLLQDGFTMRAFPEASMKKSCEVFEREYHPRMLSGWNDPTTRYTCMYTKDWGEARLTNAWNGPAVNSTEIKKIDPRERHPKDGSIFPENCQEILNQLMSCYRELARDHLHQSYSPSDAELQVFKEICPPYLDARVGEVPQILSLRSSGTQREVSTPDSKNDSLKFG